MAWEYLQFLKSYKGLSKKFWIHCSCSYDIANNFCTLVHRIQRCSRHALNNHTNNIHGGRDPIQWIAQPSFLEQIASIAVLRGTT